MNKEQLLKSKEMYQKQLEIAKVEKNFPVIVAITKNIKEVDKKLAKLEESK